MWFILIEVPGHLTPNLLFNLEMYNAPKPGTDAFEKYADEQILAAKKKAFGLFRENYELSAISEDEITGELLNTAKSHIRNI